MPQLRLTIDIPDALYEKLNPNDLENDLVHCAEMAFVFLGMFNSISDSNQDVVQGAVDALNRIEDGRLRSFLETVRG